MVVTVMKMLGKKSRALWRKQNYVISEQMHNKVHSTNVNYHTVAVLKEKGLFWIYCIIIGISGHADNSCKAEQVVAQR